MRKPPKQQKAEIHIPVAKKRFWFKTWTQYWLPLPPKSRNSSFQNFFGASCDPRAVLWNPCNLSLCERPQAAFEGLDEGDTGHCQSVLLAQRRGGNSRHSPQRWYPFPSLKPQIQNLCSIGNKV